jgi:hypothetical protein
MIKIFYGENQNDRNYIAGLISDAVFKYGCTDFEIKRKIAL